MNKERKYKIDKIKNQLQEVLDEEQFAFDNMPENLQGSMRGMESEEAIGYMEEAIEALDNIV